MCIQINKKELSLHIRVYLLAPRNFISRVDIEISLCERRLNMLSFIVFLLCLSIQSSYQNNTIVFQSGESGYSCIRIPALLTTSKGTLIAFGEARLFSCADGTQIDIAYKRSTDNGKTWSELKILVRGNETGDAYTHAGNFAPVQLRYNQRILVPFTKNNQFPMQSYSDDDGLTFSKPEFIPNITKSEWKWFALGPPGGLLLQSNRIVIPGDFSLADGHLSSSFVMLNDHNGQVDKWYLGGEMSLGDYHPNECQAVELSKPNSVFVNSRTNENVRVGSYSDDGGLTFTKIQVLKTLTQPKSGCEGSTLYHSSTRHLFYSGLAVNGTVRTNLTLYASEDEGENWSFIKTIYPGPSAYSSLATLNDQSVGILFEAGPNNPYQTLLFTIVYNGTEKKFV